MIHKCEQFDKWYGAVHDGVEQATISWRASSDRQISLSASAERAFASFRDKKHRILQLQIFATKNIVFYNCKFSQQKYCFLQSQMLAGCGSIMSPVLALTALR